MRLRYSNYSRFSLRRCFRRCDSYSIETMIVKVVYQCLEACDLLYLIFVGLYNFGQIFGVVKWSSYDPDLRGQL